MFGVIDVNHCADLSATTLSKQWAKVNGAVEEKPCSIKGSMSVSEGHGVRNGSNNCSNTKLSMQTTMKQKTPSKVKQTSLFCTSVK